MSRNWVLPEGVEWEQMTLRRPNDLQNPLGEIFSSRSLAGGSLGEFGRVEILEIEGVYFTLRQETHKRFVNRGFERSWAPQLHRIRSVFALYCITFTLYLHCICTVLAQHTITHAYTYMLPKMEGL